MNEQLLTVKEVGDVTVVYLTPTRIVDEVIIHELFGEISQLVEQQGKTKLVLNFAGVEFLSSAALGKLITLDKKIKAHKGDLALCGIRDTIWRAFEMTGLDQRFKHFEDEADALSNV